jgi:MYXO-CTERM domain-containing protein
VYIFVPPPPAANGTACTADSDCESTFCVDGVCCDTECGGGVATDCQSCLGAMTGGADGTCGTVAATANYTCRPSTGPCDPAGVCDGSSPSCPAAAAPDGGCASSSSSGASPGSVNLAGGCGCRTVGDRGDGREPTHAVWLLALGLGVVVGRRRRCRRVRT